ncbi:hypothetical protein Bbelb_144110 [Branchiostoma belcheri]|nr:hypothetical protein Bbelb_144110 [Branchiostoma belcheri]
MAELGRYPLRLEASLNAIKHFIRIRQNVPADSLSADALLCQLELDTSGAKCWASGVRKTLEECAKKGYEAHVPNGAILNPAFGAAVGLAILAGKVWIGGSVRTGEELTITVQYPTLLQLKGCYPLTTQNQNHGAAGFDFLAEINSVGAHCELRKAEEP